MQDYDSKLFTEEQIERALEENNIRAYFLEVDFKDLSREYNTGFQFAKGEVNSGFICFKLLYGESGIILKRGCTVYANIRKTTGETFKSNLSVLDYQNGIVLLSLSSQVLSIIGVDKLELAVVIDEEKTISPKIKYKVYESFDGDDKADAENHPPLLDSEDLRLLITELRKEVEVNKVNIEDLTEKTGSNLKLIQSNATKISSNTSEIEKIKQYNTNNDSKISNIENSIEENTNSISTNTNKIGELENKTNTNESNVSSNTSKIELIEGEIETLKQYDSSNDTKISEIESKVDTNKSGIANNSSKIEQAMSKIEENKTNISGNSSKISVLENKIPTIESKISGHTSKIEVIEGKIPTVESGILNNASKIDKLEKKIPTIETNISGNSSNITKIEAKVESLETSVSGNSSSIEEVKGEVATIKSSISSNTSEVSKLKEKLSGIEPNVTSVVSKVEEIERQIPAIESRISGNTSNISTVKTKVEKNTSDITKISKRLDGLVVNPNVDLEEIVQARTATTGEIFDTLDERIDHEVDRLNKKIDVTMLQQEDKESHTIENSVEGLTTDMVIKGRTLQNFKSNVKNYISKWVDNGDNYSLNLPSGSGQPSILYGLTQTLKENQKYTVIVNLIEYTSGVLHFSFMNSDGNKLASTTELVAESKGLKKFVFTINNTIKAETLRLLPRNGINNIYSVSKNILILEGDWTNKPIPEYFEGIKSFGQEEDKISILSNGKNLFRERNFIIEGTPTDKIKIDVPIINKNEQHVFSIRDFQITKPKDDWSPIIGVVYTDGSDSGTYIHQQKFVVSEKGKTIDYFYYRNPWGVGCTLIDVQIEESTKQTDYEHYKEYKKDILLSEYGFKDGLKSVNDTVFDGLNSTRNIAIKKVDKHTFTGNEDWRIMSESNNEYIYFEVNFNAKKSDKINIICNNFIARSFSELYAKNTNGISAWSDSTRGTIFIGIEKSKLTSLNTDGFKTWLKANPTTIYYELAEPVETPLSENINLKTFDEKTYVSFENNISGTSSFKAPVDSATTISRLNRENRALEEENKTLRQDFESTTLSLTDSDLELVKQNVDMDFRLMEVEFALDIPQAILSSNIKFKNKKGEVKSMARTPYEMMKIVILSGDYDREDYIHKVGKYYERGRMTKEEHDELMSLMTADEVISKKI